MNKNKAFLLALPAIGAAFQLSLRSPSLVSIGHSITFADLAVPVLIATILKPAKLSCLFCFILLLGAIGLPVFAGEADFQKLLVKFRGLSLGLSALCISTSSLTNKDSKFYDLLANLIGTTLVIRRWSYRTSFLANSGIF